MEKREKSESLVGIRSTRHGGLIKGLFQSLTESSREEEMIKTQSTFLLLPLATPRITHHCLLTVLPPPPHGLGRTSSFLRRHSVPLAILINVILQPQSGYLQFVSREDAKSRRSSSFHCFSVPSPLPLPLSGASAISLASISVSYCIIEERDVLSLLR